MSSFFHPREANQSWLRIGRVEVTSTVAVVFLGAIGLLASVISPAIPVALYYDPVQLLQGQVWRVFTWPLADVLTPWSALNLVMLWYFGSHLERTTGRNAMAKLYLGIWGSLTLAASLVRFLGPNATHGMQLIELAVLLLWIAQYPTMRFLFNIPAWAFGAFIVALNTLSMISRRDFAGLAILLIASAMIAVFARSIGLLTQYAWLPGGRSKRPAVARKPSKAQQRKQQRSQSARERIDELLDKINAEGIGSLTKKERAELTKLREQLRNG